MAQKIALDIGKKRTGIAITDTSNIIASGLTTVSTDELISYLRDQFSSTDVDTIVIGKPSHLDGSATDATTIVDEVVGKLKKSFSTKRFVFIDERFTSKLAKQAILQRGARKKERRNKALVDKVSATIILQTFLETDHS